MNSLRTTSHSRTTSTDANSSSTSRSRSAVAGKIALAAGVALAAGLASPAVASAQDAGSLTPMSTELPDYLLPSPDTLVAWGGSPTGMCQGAVAAKITSGGYPDSSSLSWGIAMPGIGVCNLTVTVEWHNLDSGQTGEKTLQVNQPTLWAGVSHPYEAIVSTGPGTVQYRLSTNAGAAAGPITVVTPKYEG